MEEVSLAVSPRISRNDRPVSERPGRFAYPPQLLLVDGGKGQLAAARVLKELGSTIPAASLAKRYEEVRARRSDPIEIPRQSEALYLCSECVTRRTASPTASIASCVTSAASVLDDVPASDRPARNVWSRSCASTPYAAPRSRS
jgi:excinuclease ABC subunit C